MDVLTILKGIEGGALFILAVLVIWERMRKQTEPPPPSLPPECAAIPARIEQLQQDITELRRHITQREEKTSRIVEHFDERDDDLESRLEKIQKALAAIHKYVQDSFEMHNVYVPGTKTPVWFRGKDAFDQATAIREKAIPEMAAKMKEHTVRITEQLSKLEGTTQELRQDLRRQQGQWKRARTDTGHRPR